jgi:hypothetical protein
MKVEQVRRIKIGENELSDTVTQPRVTARLRPNKMHRGSSQVSI